MVIANLIFYDKNNNLKANNTMNQSLKSIIDAANINFAIEVDVSRQQCFLYDRAGIIQRSYSVSTASVGINNAQNSNGTPTGLHQICDCIGEGQPLGRRFQGRVANQQIIEILNAKPDTPPKEDFILTRILRLKGLEPGLNLGAGCDSFSRYIYFHGTNEEYLIGTPASHGCIRMRNEDIVELFALVAVGTPVFIY